MTTGAQGTPFHVKRRRQSHFTRLIDSDCSASLVGEKPVISVTADLLRYYHRLRGDNNCLRMLLFRQTNCWLEETLLSGMVSAWLYIILSWPALFNAYNLTILSAPLYFCWSVCFILFWCWCFFDVLFFVVVAHVNDFFPFSYYRMLCLQLSHLAHLRVQLLWRILANRNKLQTSTDSSVTNLCVCVCVFVFFQTTVGPRWTGHWWSLWRWTASCTRAFSSPPATPAGGCRFRSCSQRPSWLSDKFSADAGSHGSVCLDRTHRMHVACI